MKIPIDKLVVCPLQKRAEKMDNEEFADLVKTIKAGGVDNVLLVRPVGDVFEVCDGGRRLLAAASLGMTELECNVKEMTDLEAIKAIIRCGSSKPKTLMERYEELDELRKQLGLEKDFYRALAEETGQGHSQIADLFDWASVVRNMELSASGQLPSVKVVVATRDLLWEDRIKLVKKAIAEGLSEKQVKSLRDDILGTVKGARARLGGATKPRTKQKPVVQSVFVGSGHDAEGVRGVIRWLESFYDDEWVVLEKTGQEEVKFALAELEKFAGRMKNGNWGVKETKEAQEIT
jgi:ParB/RepB/Spo0J family partition protein